LIECRSYNGQGLPAVSNVLILTASVGGGHAASGRAIRAELDRSGHHVVVEDGLRIMSLALSWLLSTGYCRQARNSPRSLAAVFAVTSMRAGAWSVRAVVGLLFARRLIGTIRRESPDLVISTYPLVTAALGRLRAGGELMVPAAAVITDYGVHPLWVMPGIDIHLVASQLSAELVRRVGGEAALVRMPVDPSFSEAPARDAARATLGIPSEAFVALVVGGTWGDRGPGGGGPVRRGVRRVHRRRNRGEHRSQGPSGEGFRR
jgi:processive 1,2-diacylglycerol beta-glucosyltransferase